MKAGVACRGRTPCAICDQTNQTMRLCDACRTDPANDGWNERTLYADRAWLESPGDDDDRNAADLDARHRLAELHDRKAATVSERTRQILQLVALYQVVDRRRPDGRARTQQEWIVERRPLHLAEIAFLVGVSPQAVAKTLRRYEPLMRSVLASTRSANRDW